MEINKQKGADKRRAKTCANLGNKDNDGDSGGPE